LGLVESLGAFFLLRVGRRVVHFYRNMFSLVPKGEVREVTAILDAIHAQDGRGESLCKATVMVKKGRLIRSAMAVELVDEGIDEP